MYALNPGASVSAPSFMSGYNISYLSMDEGLPHNFVDDIFRDSRGFVWIGLGGGGLTRYDGNEFVNFNTSSEKYPLPGNFAIEMLEDPFSRLWVATDGGITLIDIYSLQPVELTDHTGRLHELFRSHGWSLCVDSENRVWVRSDTHLGCIAFNSDGEAESIAMSETLRRPSAPTAVRDVECNGNPWSVVDGSVRRLVPDFASQTVRAVPVADCLTFVPDIMVSDYIMNGSEIWIATDLGLVRYNPAENISKTYLNEPGNSSSLSQNFINTLAVTNDKRLIAGTLRGLNIYNPISDTFERVTQRPETAGGLNNNFVNKIFPDGDNIWVGTEGCGINLFIPKTLSVTEFSNNFSTPGRSFNTPVNAILAENDGTVWIGSVEGGLHRSSNGLKTFRHYSANDGTLPHNSVSALARDGEGNLLVGTWGGGVSVLKTTDDGNVTALRQFISTDDSVHHIGYIGALAWDSLNKLVWIGASRGLFVYNPADRTVREAFPNSTDMIFGALGAAVDRDAHLWLGTSKGLIDIDLLKYSKTKSADAVRHLRGRFNNPDAVADERITTVFIDRDNRLWIGTNGSGLYFRVFPENGILELFESINTSDGLPNDIIHGIAQDRDGNIWVSTYSGLACMDSEGNIRNYDKGGDLINDRFYWNAAATDSRGNILFGTTSGLLAIHGQISGEKENSVPINFTHVWVDNNEILPGGTGSTSFCPVRGLKIHESSRSVSFEFSAMDYNHNRRGTYSYRLTGFDSDWTTLAPGRRFVRYTNLAPGKYTLQVRYIHKGAPESEALISEIPLEVSPYFYKRWWFILILIIGIGALATLFYKLRMASLKNKQRHLESLVAERTAEIEEQKRQVQQLTMDRISFFTNISHEFRTPITLILGPIEKALKLSYNPSVIQQLHLVQRNSKYLLSLVNQIMDFRKIEAGKMEIMRSKGNLLVFLDNLVESFRPMAKDRNITLSLIPHLPRPVMSFDEEALQKVMINLLGNAMKYTPDGGRICVRATVLPRGCAGDESPAIYLSVSDTGNGIDPADISHIFDRFYQGKSQLKYPVVGSSDSGIGLYLCQSLVDIYGGKISVQNNHNGIGCCFRVILPLPAGEEPEFSTEPDAPEIPEELPTPDEAAKNTAAPDDARLTVLVVEDNDDMRAFIRTILSPRFSVAEARNGEEALKVLSNREIGLIISDLMMPVMDGLELSRKVKENFNFSHIPFLMLTAKEGREPRLESYRMGVDEYILKPFDEELLLARIENILRSRQRYQTHFAGALDVESLNITEDSRDKKFMDQVMQVIQDNYRNSYFEIGDFAEALGVSRSLLNKKLQSIAGQSAGQLLRSFRLNTARELIIRNRHSRAMNISEIAYEVGFNDSKYFTRCFTKQFNITPSSLMNAE